MVTLQWASIERGRCRAVRRQKNTQATHGGIAVRARPSAPTTHYFLLPSSLLSTCPIRGSKMCFVCFVVSLLPPQATRGGIAVRARPSSPSTHFFLLPTLYSLLAPFVVHLHLRRRTAESPCGRSTEAHCKVTTHYLLLPPPYSLL